MSETGTDRRALAKGMRGVAIGLTTALGLGACSTSNLDWDLRRSGGFSTADAAREATAQRPQPDARGVISYPGYQVVVAQRGDSARSIAARLGIDAVALARHNAIEPDAMLRGGETLVLPSRVADMSSGPIAVTPLDPSPGTGGMQPAGPGGPEPTRHEVARGETAFSIARLYNVSPRSLAEWNGLPADMSVREGQLLIIPVPQSITQAAAGQPLSSTGGLPPSAGAPATVPGMTPTPGDTPTMAGANPPSATEPGQGSPTPVPPSATQPLPPTNPSPAGQGAGAPATPPVADMAAQRTEAPRLSMPVDGRIIRAYARGRNDGIGISAAAGTPVRAAAAGTVAAITRDTDQVPIMVVRHANNLLTVYANIDDIRVERGAQVASGQTIAVVRPGDPPFLHFEVREGFDSVDPMPYLQ